MAESFPVEAYNTPLIIERVVRFETIL